MYNDGFSDEDKLNMVAEAQSYEGDDPDDNRYLGLDEFHCANIRKGQKLYAFKPDIICKKLYGGEKPEKVDIYWFFDQATFDRLVKDGMFNSREVAEYLQLDYWSGNGPFDQGGEYSDSILAFDLKEDIRVPVGECLANDQFGYGGAHQCYIHKDMVERLQENRLLVFNKDESLIHKGTDKYITDFRCDQIDKAADKKKQFCQKNNQKHCTNPFFAVSADAHEDIPSVPFDCDHIGKDSTYDTIKNEKIDPSKPITGPRAGDHFVKANEISTSKIVEYEPEIDKTEKTDSKKEHELVTDTVLAGKPDAENIKDPLAGLYCLQKYLDHTERTEYTEETVFQANNTVCNNIDLLT